MKVFLWEELGDGLYGNVHFKSFGKVGNVGTVPIGRIGFYQPIAIREESRGVQ